MECTRVCSTFITNNMSLLNIFLRRAVSLSEYSTADLELPDNASQSLELEEGHRNGVVYPRDGLRHRSEAT